KRKIEEINNVNINYRTTINPKNLESLINNLKGIGHSSDIIVVESSDKKIQIQAAKDSRVDVISNFRSGPICSVFDVLSVVK
ncbi:unnamed protein product, partial [marine sediment metagenome]